jgi:GMP synthase-like glutamine amidotransferase
MRRALVFQHMDHDHPGRFADFLAEDGLVPEMIRLFEGQVIPNLAPYDFLFVLGGAQDAWQEESHEFLKAEKEAIREWVWDRAKPYFGVCLGHQLLCDALGGEVAMAAQGEVGVHEVSLTEDGKEHPLTAGVPASMKVMQWHWAEVKRAPQGASVLASSPLSAIQAVAVDGHAMATQFHCEFSPQSMAGWSSLPEYVTSLEKHKGPGGYQRLLEEALPLMTEMGRVTRRMYDNLMQGTGLRK